MAHRIDPTLVPGVLPGDSDKGYSHARYSPPAKARLPSPAFEDDAIAAERRARAAAAQAAAEARAEREKAEADAALAALNRSGAREPSSSPASGSPQRTKPSGTIKATSPTKIFIYEGFSTSEIHSQHPGAVAVDKAETLVYEAMAIAAGQDPREVERSFEAARQAELMQTPVVAASGSVYGSSYGGSVYGAQQAAPAYPGSPYFQR